MLNFEPIFVVLLTTHYIEEAANADFVAFLRGGKILEEGRPAEMLERFSSNSLENLFLQLCCEAEKLQIVGSENTNLLEQENDHNYDNKQSQTQFGDILPEILEQKTSIANFSDINKQLKKTKVTWLQKTKALLFKNLMVLRRHRMFMLFNILLPVLNFGIFVQAVGRPLANLSVSVAVNGTSDSLSAVQDISDCSTSIASVSENFCWQFKFPFFV